MTRRLVDYIRERSLVRTFTEVADDVGVNEKTVRNVFREYVCGKACALAAVKVMRRWQRVTDSARSGMIAEPPVTVSPRVGDSATLGGSNGCT